MQIHMYTLDLTAKPETLPTNMYIYNEDKNRKQ